MPRGAFIALVIVAGLVILVVVGKTLFKRVEQNLEGLKDLSIATPPLSSIEDGTYEGSYATFPVKAKVQQPSRKEPLQTSSSWSIEAARVSRLKRF
jgi:uncharacterized protein with FMN-binding domain